MKIKKTLINVKIVYETNIFYNIISIYINKNGK